MSALAGTGAPDDQRPGRPVHVAVIGLEFGAEFAPIYRDHPDVRRVTVCDRDPDVLTRTTRRLGADVRASADLGEVLADPDVDAVHLVTGLPDHAAHTIRAMEAGKHVACAVPMALSIDEIEAVLDARRRTQTIYMMMETAVFTREALHVQRLARDGWFGEITFGRGSHIQDMTAWPGYWTGLPPMYYLTHALAPLLAVVGTSVRTVRALGSGRFAPGSPEPYGPTFPVECALFDLVDHPAALEITRSLGRFARAYTEAFSVYGSERSFEWPALEHEEEPVVYELGELSRGGRGREVTWRRTQVGDQVEGLPESLRPHLTRHEATGADGVTFWQGGGHGGSHPHLVHEFVSAVRDGRRSSIDHVRAAQWTAPGILAHQSALAGGAVVHVPSFDD